MSDTKERPIVEVARHDVTSALALSLITELNAELTDTYPEPGATHFRLDADEVSGSRGVFLVASIAGEPVGCGAIRRIDAESAEIKRMYVRAAQRNRGVAKIVLDELESHARRLGVRRLVLETGERQIHALALYTRAGYVRIPPFGEYVDSPLSLCMEKKL
jgi:GNAT superfamily N-acetyltransferase